MREFTKEHNDLMWLFPIAKNKKEANEIFDECEEYAKSLAENFDYSEETQDVAVDAFMKGCSSAMQMYLEGIIFDTIENLYNNLFDVKPIEECKTEEEKDEHYRFLRFKVMLEHYAKCRKALDGHVYNTYDSLKKYFRSMIDNTAFDSNCINREEIVKLHKGK